MATSGIQIRCGPEHVESISHTLTEAVTAGYLTKVQDTVGVYFKAGAIGDVVAFVFKAAKIVLSKDTTAGQTFSAGAKVYYNPFIHKVGNQSSGNTYCGIALEDATAAATTLLVAFDGTPIA